MERTVDHAHRRLCSALIVLGIAVAATLMAPAQALAATLTFNHGGTGIDYVDVTLGNSNTVVLRQHTPSATNKFEINKVQVTPGTIVHLHAHLKSNAQFDGYHYHTVRVSNATDPYLSTGAFSAKTFGFAVDKSKTTNSQASTKLRDYYNTFVMPAKDLYIYPCAMVPYTIDIEPNGGCMTDYTGSKLHTSSASYKTSWNRSTYVGGWQYGRVRVLWRSPDHDFGSATLLHLETGSSNFSTIDNIVFKHPRYYRFDGLWDAPVGGHQVYRAKTQQLIYSGGKWRSQYTIGLVAVDGAYWKNNKLIWNPASTPKGDGYLKLYAHWTNA